MADGDQTRTASEVAQGEGSEALDWTKPLPDPKLEKMRLDMVRLHNAKNQETADARHELAEERARLRQDVEDEVLATLEDRGAFTEEEKAAPKPVADEELTEAQRLQAQLDQVKNDYGSLRQALQDERVNREAERIRAEIARGMSRFQQVFPAEDTEDPKEVAFREECVDDIARQYAISGDARARKPLLASVKKVAEKIAFIRTRGKTVKTATDDGGRRHPRPEGDGGGGVSMPDDLKDMGLDDNEFVTRLIAATGDKD
jgi:hypothetical protein